MLARTVFTLSCISALTLACSRSPKPAASIGEAPPVRTLSAGDLRKSGTVQLNVTCKPDVQKDFQTSLALLHSFFYEEARRQFRGLAERDPSCAMAHWGVAMTYYHPLWAPPTSEEMAAGTKAAREAKARIAGTTDLERGFIEAIDAFYRTEDDETPGGPVAQSCHGPRAHTARAQAFRAALERLYRQYPRDVEAQSFYAMALVGTAPPTDKTYAQQLAAAAILEPLFVSHPDHPGVTHYLIHAYDYPELAARGLPASRRYEAVAPWVPHALHMPSHIYTRLGMWDASIEANRQSSNAAREYAARTFGGAAWSEELHALDYLGFAYLQTGHDKEAAAVVDHVRNVKTVYDPVFSAAYALGAIPVRFALERGQWKEAASLPVLHPEVMKAFPFALAHVEFAHAVGAARTGDLPRAREAVARLQTLRESLDEPKFRWWMDQVEIQRLAGAAWVANAEGNAKDAERLLRAAGDLEDKAGTHPVTPGQIMPAHEQLGDLLLLAERPAEALGEFEKSLQAFPQRFNSHNGAARAAERAGQRDVARKHYEQLVAMAGRGDGKREELAHARAFLAR